MSIIILYVVGLPTHFTSVRHITAKDLLDLVLNSYCFRGIFSITMFTIFSLLFIVQIFFHAFKVFNYRKNVQIGIMT